MRSLRLLNHWFYELVSRSITLVSLNTAEIAPSLLETRKTYRAVLSEPKLILSDGTVASTSSTGTASKAKAMDIDILPNPNEGSEALLPTSSTKSTAGLGKRARDDANETSPQDGTSKVETGKKKKKKKQHPDSSVVKT